MKILPFPQLRQTYCYDCGATALQMVLVYYGIKIRKDKVIKTAKTGRRGTKIMNIIKTAEKYNLKIDAGKMSIKDLQNYIDNQIPVIILLQAWSNQTNNDWENDWRNGHYAVVIGYDNQKIIFADPCSFEKTFLSHNELNQRWHDVDMNKKQYYQYGIALYGKEPIYDPDAIVHMD